MRRVDFVSGNPTYAHVRVSPVLAICPPRALLKTTLKPDATPREVAQVVTRFQRRPDVAQGKVADNAGISSREYGVLKQPKGLVKRT
jgi:hypothetical protein